jgi:RNA polymerase sigma-70 factor, ECF subfamily
MLRLALVYVRGRAIAEEVVQETWIGVLDGIDRFEGRSSLRTWVFSILVNQAKTRAERERRSLPFSALGAEASVDPDRFLPAHDPWAGHWATSPKALLPEEQLLAAELRERLAAAIRRLPESQRAVLALRDVEGWSPEEVCNVLQLTDANRRVLLHRARGALRRTLDRYLQDVSG